MKFSKWILPLAAAATLLTAGCAERTYVAGPPPPPPPPYQGVPALVEQAEHNGFRSGMDDGARDSTNGFGYHPKRDGKFRDTPGYYPQLGPFGPYQSYFRNAYLRGYYKGFYRQ